MPASAYPYPRVGASPNMAFIIIKVDSTLARQVKSMIIYSHINRIYTLIKIITLRLSSMKVYRCLVLPALRLYF